MWLGRVSSSCSTCDTRCLTAKRQQHHLTWKIGYTYISNYYNQYDDSEWPNFILDLGKYYLKTHSVASPIDHYIVCPDFDLRFLITPFESSNFSYLRISLQCKMHTTV